MKRVAIFCLFILFSVFLSQTMAHTKFRTRNMSKAKTPGVICQSVSITKGTVKVCGPDIVTPPQAEVRVVEEGCEKVRLNGGDWNMFCL